MNSGSAKRKTAPIRRDRSAADYLPDIESLAKLANAARHCRGCDLYQRATQTVFGKGRSTARLMLVGEAPGDREDAVGKPFVGSAGRLLDEALTKAGINRKTVYLTNAIKHFKWEPRGKRRLHAKPSSREITACRPWLEAEIRVIAPETIVCLGATAAQALLGRNFRLTKHFGEAVQSHWADRIFATYHPSAILRAPEHVERKRLTTLFIAHPKLAASKLVPLKKQHFLWDFANIKRGEIFLDRQNLAADLAATVAIPL